MWKKIRRATLEAVRKSMSDMDATPSVDEDAVQVNHARQQAVITGLQQQLDDIKSTEAKLKKKPSKKASATIPSAGSVVAASDGMDPLESPPL